MLTLNPMRISALILAFYSRVFPENIIKKIRDNATSDFSVHFK